MQKVRKSPVEQVLVMLGIFSHSLFGMLVANEANSVLWDEKEAQNGRLPLKSPQG